MSYFKSNIDAMTPYVPGFQPGPEAIKLNANENPYPPSPKAWEALAHISDDELRVYPDPTGAVFTAAVAETLGVPQSRVLAGNGSDNVLAAVIHAAGGPIAIPTPTFPYYETLSQVEGAEIIEVPTDENFRVDFDALAEANAAVTFLANPNNPTGVLEPLEAIEALARKLDGLLVVDEAYYDFCGVTALPLVDTCDNVIVTRTLSKGYSLASLRMGFAIAQEPILEALFKAMEIYNVSTTTLLAGARAFVDQD
ncbi:MAG: histidinol-phosphate aminotransferase family protein, partial [Phycisphaerales bacterium]|nr:histidinol-phosphate aminotransferase family protein [Phycisphaerales bacterium]